MLATWLLEILIGAALLVALALSVTLVGLVFRLAAPADAHEVPALSRPAALGGLLLGLALLSGPAMQGGFDPRQLFNPGGAFDVPPLGAAELALAQVGVPQHPLGLWLGAAALALVGVALVAALLLWRGLHALRAVLAALLLAGLLAALVHLAGHTAAWLLARLNIAALLLALLAFQAWRYRH
jgi:hypothetical protein